MSEKARKIVCSIEQKIHEYDYNGASDIIAAAIDAERKAGREEVIEGNRTYTSHEWGHNKEREFQARRDGDAEGYRRGLNEAAEIVEGGSRLHESEKELADRIRQRGGKL
jgi:hypothetical protein